VAVAHPDRGRHALSIAVVVAVVLALGLSWIAIFWIVAGPYSWAGLYYALYGHRHRVRVGMQTGMVGLGCGRSRWRPAMAPA